MKPRFFLVVAGLAVSYTLCAAEITIPRLEWFSRAATDKGELVVSSSADADLAVNGGYKYGIRLGLGLEIPNIEKALSYGRLDIPYAETASNSGSVDETSYNSMVDEMNDRVNNQATLSFRMLEATVRELFNKPLEFSFFAGKYDALASGDEFAVRFGTVPVGTDMRGFFYYADGLRVIDPAARSATPPVADPDPRIRFNGAIHNISGTGVKLTYMPVDWIIPSLYIYQDISFKDSRTGSYKTGHYSGDLKLLLNSEHIKLEAFAGATYINEKTSTAGETKAKAVLRGGLLAFFSSGVGADLLLQAGVPYWRQDEEFDIDNCYFLLEPRFRFGMAGVTLTLFYHPSYFNNMAIIDEGGKLEHGLSDFNLKLYFGDLVTTAFQGGIEGTLEMRVQESEDIKVWVSPFISAVSSGLYWDFKIRVNPRYFTSNEKKLAEGYIGIRTSF
ncbi:MAG: hypothetical protein LBJ31_06915 [Treponema sp.]|nr:hypothetical protein [Treponema sp.]